MSARRVRLFSDFFLCLALTCWCAAVAAKTAVPTCERKLFAEVVAIEQAIVLNRLGAFNPAGMLFALRRDIVFSGHSTIPDGTTVDDANLPQAPGFVKLREGKRPRPLVLRSNEGDCLEVRFHNLLMRGVPDERSGGPEQYKGRVPAHLEDADGKVYNQGAGSATGQELVQPTAISNDIPHTRAASFHVNGLDVVPVPAAQCPLSTAQRQWICGTDGDNVGLNRATVHPATPQPLRGQLERQAGQIYPGQSAVYRMYAFREGTYFAYSTGTTVGGEGDGGQLGAGLFGAVNVQPAKSRWYRSQVTHSDLLQAARPVPVGQHQYASLDYDGARYASGPFKGRPILAMLDGFEIVHSDLNAIVALTGPAPDHNDTTGPSHKCKDYAPGTSCGSSYREFTVIMHDEVKAVQAFAELEDQSNPLHYLKDGMGINYGVAGMGAMVVARNRRLGPVKDCPECRAEEFFLSSWANGDPALVLKWDEQGKKPIGAMYPDDPSNVHHSYLNDPVRFRNIHAGPKETHVFHLHAHQWVSDASQPGSTYLDSQTISPGATFSYEIEFGGSGNRNLSPGDSIFHCHLYPHFAQGMWELWRVHDVFENGGSDRKLQDAEIASGTENPAIVPIPGSAMALMPTPDFMGYPFYVAGQAGHRPPQPPLDFGTTVQTTAGSQKEYVDGGLGRHVLTGWEDKGNLTERALANQDVMEAALSKGSKTAQINARRVSLKNQDKTLMALAEEWHEIGVEGIAFLAPDGEPKEKRAMAFHAGTLNAPGFVPANLVVSPHPNWLQEKKAYQSQWAATVAGQAAPTGAAIFPVNGRKEVAGAPFADPCPVNAPMRNYKAGVIQTELTVNRHGWFDPQARILSLEQDIKDIINPNDRDRLPEPLFFRANSGDCIQFEHSNFVPSALALDDFQIYTPTDTIGQHIHLVKFDVTSSDGSGNGWNYEDGTFSPEEVRERLHAVNAARTKANPARQAAGLAQLPLLPLKTHPLFSAACAEGDRRCLALKDQGTCPANAHLMPLKELAAQHPFCGAQRTVQRWYADPILDPKVAPGYKATGRDYTLRTVFSHDHFGPSSHQQHGLYSALIVEPSNSVWLALDQNNLTVDDWSHLCSSEDNLKQLARAKVIGGANLSALFDGECVRRTVPKAVAANELREPLKLRDDGGPTATRANIISPRCLTGQLNGGSRKDSNPIDPRWTADKTACAVGLETRDTRREYALAFADFAILYNTALEPINPEQRDLSALRLGNRQVPVNKPMPLGISSEDPGTQLINYRNEPVPLRVAEVRSDQSLGGFNYRQLPCPNGAGDCSSDMSNVFSTKVHAKGDKLLGSNAYGAVLSPQTRDLLKDTPVGPHLDTALADVERWRRDFNCALYPADPTKPADPLLGADCRLRRLEPWRVLGDPATPILPVYEGDTMYVRLIQGAQEAQHVFAATGQHWLREPDNPRSGYVSAQPLGISEHFEFDIKPSPVAVKRYDSLYMGSSVDQLWDGMWGVIRSYGVEYVKDPAGKEIPTRPAWAGVAKLDSLRGNPVPTPATPLADNKTTQVCSSIDPANPSKTTYVSRLRFDISAVRACELTGGCDLAGRHGITYNQRLGMDDPNAIVFVRNNKLPGAPEPDHTQDPNAIRSNAQVLAQLKAEFAQKKRRLEPLVLRAPAGACMEVTLRNHLPPEIGDGVLEPPGLQNTAHFSDNFMSMILDGFNYNQIRTSSSVGLSAPMVARDPLSADGGNFGINSLEVARAEASDDAGSGTGTAPGVLRPQPVSTLAQNKFVPQGNLVPPCDGSNRFDIPCRRDSMLWFAGEYDLDSRGKQLHLPVEFGALPLSSYADVIKHPAHGAIGALVIGPKGSRVCTSDDAAERNADAASETSATICLPSGKRYRDFVMVLQDAVDAKIKGDLVPNLKGAEEPDDYGIKAVNFRTEPLWGRRGGDPSIDFEERNEFDFANVLSSKLDGETTDSPCQAGITKLAQDHRNLCDPETPLFVARVGSEVRLRVVHPGGHTRQQAVTLHGHDWNPSPWALGSRQMLSSHRTAMASAWTAQGSFNGVGPMMGANLLVQAGGRQQLPMDYLWRSQASFVYDGGIWGLMRVTPASNN